MEPLLCLLMGIGIVASTIFVFSNINWIGLGGKLRDWYWYESLIMNITIILPIIIIISEIYNFIKIKKDYKIYTFAYLIIEIIISYIIYMLANPFAILISIFLFNLIKCIYRIINENKILKKN